jgi:hypothetical protein
VQLVLAVAVITLGDAPTMAGVLTVITQEMVC